VVLYSHQQGVAMFGFQRFTC